MKSNFINLLMMGRTLVRVKDRTGAYKLPHGEVFPRFGSSGRQKAASVTTVRPAASTAQPVLFKGLEEEPVQPQAAAVQTAPPSATTMPVYPQVLKVKFPPPASSGTFTLALGSSSSRRAWMNWSWRRALRFFSRQPAPDMRPRAQAELALEKVTVLRNDLSESDLVVVPSLRRASETQAATPPVNAWSRVTARWIKLEEPAPPAAVAGTEARSGQWTEIKS